MPTSRYTSIDANNKIDKYRSIGNVPFFASLTRLGVDEITVGRRSGNETQEQASATHDAKKRARVLTPQSQSPAPKRNGL